jgi:UPF0176 protein
LLFLQCADCAQLHQGTCSPECHSILRLPEEEQRALRKARRRQNALFQKGRIQGLNSTASLRM